MGIKRRTAHSCCAESTIPTKLSVVPQIDNAHSIGCTAVSWAPALPSGGLVSAQPPSSAVKRFATSGCDNTVKVRPSDQLLVLCVLFRMCCDAKA